MSRQGDAVRARLAKRFPGFKPIELQPAEIVVADSVKWRKVSAPRPWHPKNEGDVLIGELMSSGIRSMPDGSTYGIVVLRTHECVRTVSGVVITALFDAADLPEGALVRVVFRGDRQSASGRIYRDFDLFTADISEELP